MASDQLISENLSSASISTSLREQRDQTGGLFLLHCIASFESPHASRISQVSLPHFPKMSTDKKYFPSSLPFYILPKKIRRLQCNCRTINRYWGGKVQLSKTFAWRIPIFFICGAADRSRKGKCCSCCSCFLGGWGLGGLFSDLPYTLKIVVSREYFSCKRVYPEKTFLQNGCIRRKLLLQNWCIKRKLFFKMGAFTKNFCCKIDASRQNITSKWMHQVPFFYKI